MKLRPQISGDAFRIVAVVLNNGDCPAVDYLRELKTDIPAAHKKMHSTLYLHAAQGPIKNKKVSRPLRGKRYKDILEFKTPQGARLFYFYIPGGTTALTNGCNKTMPSEPCYERARRIKLQVEEELGLG